MMRKILLLLALLMLAMTLTAFAAEYYEFSEPAYAGLYGRDLNLSFQRVRTGSGSGVLLVLDENGELKRKADIFTKRTIRKPEPVAPFFSKNT